MGWDSAKPALIFICQQSLALSKAPSPKKAAIKPPKVLPLFFHPPALILVSVSQIPEPPLEEKRSFFSPLSCQGNTGSRELAVSAVLKGAGIGEGWTELGPSSILYYPGRFSQLSPFFFIFSKREEQIFQPSLNWGSGRCPCPWNGISPNPSNPNQSGILRFLPPPAQFPPFQGFPHIPKISFNTQNLQVLHQKNPHPSPPPSVL